MKIAWCADVHLSHNHKRFGGPIESSINRRGRQALAAFRAAQQRAVKAGASVFVVLGDLFDTDRPVPQLLAEVRSDFATIGPKMKRVLLVGNHDQTSDAPGDHALGPLAGDNAIVVEKPTSLSLGVPGERETVLHLLPFRTVPAREWFADAVRERVAEGCSRVTASAASTANVLLGFHLGIIDGKTPPFLRDAHDAIEVAEVQRVIAECEIDAAFCGNWHSHDVWNTLVAQIMQLGALCPTGFDNAGTGGYGTLAVYDTEARKTKTYRIPGPRFLVRFFEEPIDEIAAEVGSGDQLYIQLICTPAQLDEGAKQIEHAIKAGWIVDGEAVTDEKARAEAAQNAASAARDAGALAEALAAFVGKMPLPPGVGADRVLELALDYLKRAGVGR
jgi:DNA repair exonuclease SbcCD nuclease subunit